MSINSYKLVPVKMFEDLIKGACIPLGKSRSVSSIREESENNIQDVTSTQKYSTPNPPKMSMGGNKNASAPHPPCGFMKIRPNCLIIHKEKKSQTILPSIRIC